MDTVPVPCGWPILHPPGGAGTAVGGGGPVRRESLLDVQELPSHPALRLIRGGVPPDHQEVVRLTFYLPHHHDELAAGVSRALDLFLDAVGEEPEAIGTWCDTEGEGDWFSLDETGWEVIRSWLRPGSESGERCFVEEWDAETFVSRHKKGFETSVHLSGGTSGPSGYEFHYTARLPWRTPGEQVSRVSFSVPTEYLEAEG